MGAPVTTDSWGGTPLHDAAENGHMEVRPARWEVETGSPQKLEAWELPLPALPAEITQPAQQPSGRGVMVSLLLVGKVRLRRQSLPRAQTLSYLGARFRLSIRAHPFLCTETPGVCHLSQENPWLLRSEA